MSENALSREPRIWEMKEIKYTKRLAKSQVCAPIFHMGNIRKNVLPKFMKASYGDAMFGSLSGAQIWLPETNRDICENENLFKLKDV